MYFAASSHTLTRYYHNICLDFIKNISLQCILNINTATGSEANTTICLYEIQKVEQEIPAHFLNRKDMHMALFRVRDGFISAQVSEIFHEPLGE